MCTNIDKEFDNKVVATKLLIPCSDYETAIQKINIEIQGTQKATQLIVSASH